jgi:hypothetical protein
VRAEQCCGPTVRCAPSAAAPTTSALHMKPCGQGHCRRRRRLALQQSLRIPLQCASSPVQEDMSRRAIIKPDDQSKKECLLRWRSGFYSQAWRPHGHFGKMRMLSCDYRHSVCCPRFDICLAWLLWDIFRPRYYILIRAV